MVQFGHRRAAEVTRCRALLRLIDYFRFNGSGPTNDHIRGTPSSDSKSLSADDIERKMSPNEGALHEDNCEEGDRHMPPPTIQIRRHDDRERGGGVA
jgi:hypothetical protein